MGMELVLSEVGLIGMRRELVTTCGGLANTTLSADSPKPARSFGTVDLALGVVRNVTNPIEDLGDGQLLPHATDCHPSDESSWGS